MAEVPAPCFEISSDLRRSVPQILVPQHLYRSQLFVGTVVVSRTCVEGDFVRWHTGGKVRCARLRSALVFEPSLALHACKEEVKEDGLYCKVAGESRFARRVYTDDALCSGAEGAQSN